MENVFDEDDRAALLASDVPLARAVGEMLDFYFDFYVETYGERSSALHDPLAAAIAVGGIDRDRRPGGERRGRHLAGSGARADHLRSARAATRTRWISRARRFALCSEPMPRSLRT